MNFYKLVCKGDERAYFDMLVHDLFSNNGEGLKTFVSILLILIILTRNFKTNFLYNLPLKNFDLCQLKIIRLLVQQKIKFLDDVAKLSILLEAH
jgi:hypothetical protein